MTSKPEPKPDACPYCRGAKGYESGSKGKPRYVTCLQCKGTGRKEQKP